MSRRKARELALQAIYQWQMNPMTLAELVEQFVESDVAHRVDAVHFKNIIEAVVNHTPELDMHLQLYLDRKIEELNPIELGVLRLSVYEMKHCKDVPYRVVINEGLELAKKFGSSDGHKYVNGILDKLATEMRSIEKSAA